MVFEEESMKDKLGRTIVFRNARPEDAGDLIKYLKITSAETPYLVREPEEITITKSKEEQFIRDKEQNYVGTLEAVTDMTEVKEHFRQYFKSHPEEL